VRGPGGVPVEMVGPAFAGAANGRVAPLELVRS